MESWREYTLKADRENQELPVDEHRTVEVKSLTVRDSLLLAKSNAVIANYVKDAIADPEINDLLKGTRPDVMAVFARLILGTRNYKNFNGIEEQGPMQALLDGPPEYDGLYPMWVFELLNEVTKDKELTEEEAKN